MGAKVSAEQKVRIVKKLMLGLAAAGILLAGCGGGSDTLSKVVGPNPISDVHSAVDRWNDNGWTEARKAEFRGQLRGTYPSLTASQASCLTDYYTGKFSYEQLTDPNRYPTASEEAAAEAAITSCLA
jgi:hypothetical protein